MYPISCGGGRGEAMAANQLEGREVAARPRGWWLFLAARATDIDACHKNNTLVRMRGRIASTWSKQSW